MDRWWRILAGSMAGIAMVILAGCEDEKLRKEVDAFKTATGNTERQFQAVVAGIEEKLKSQQALITQLQTDLADMQSRLGVIRDQAVALQNRLEEQERKGLEAKQASLVGVWGIEKGTKEAARFEFFADGTGTFETFNPRNRRWESPENVMFKPCEDGELGCYVIESPGRPRARISIKDEVTAVATVGEGDQSVITKLMRVPLDWTPRK
jgi:hypothetical protein